MTDKTTRIWVDLTDEQMDYLTGHRVTVTPSAYNTLKEAILAQRPRPIAVGDRVVARHAVDVVEVKTIEGGWAWLWKGGCPWASFGVGDLTRVDDEAAT